MKITPLLCCLAAMLPMVAHADDLQPADSKNIQYVGRVDFSNPKLPRFWSPGVYVKAKFRGTYCNVVLNDQVLWGNSHNYVEIAVDDQPPVRVQTTGPINTIAAAKNLADGVHTITVCKDTEAGNGYLELVGFRCEALVKPAPLPRRKIEFIGDSITCGFGNDASAVACGKGQWYDQHNAYMAYGPVTARRLDSQWALTSVSGIGMFHSCCDHTTTMPQVLDRMNIGDAGDPGKWDFSRYQPDIVTICLGQNDGGDHADEFRKTYVDFLHTLRQDYPKAEIVCLTSPMADPNLDKIMQANLTWIVDQVTQAGDKHVRTFFFDHHYNGGCATHPNMDEDAKIADELVPALTSTMKW